MGLQDSAQWVCTSDQSLPPPRSHGSLSAGAQPSLWAARPPKGWAPELGHGATPTSGPGPAVTCSQLRARLGRPVWVLGQSEHPPGKGHCSRDAST